MPGSVVILLCGDKYILLFILMPVPCQGIMIPTHNPILFPTPEEWNVLCWILLQVEDAQKDLPMGHAMHLDPVMYMHPSWLHGLL